MVEVPDHFAVTLEDLGVLDFHLLFLLWLDGKNANLEQALPGILEERGVERLANDVLVNLAGFLIVVGLTIAATMIKLPLSVILIAFPVGLKAAFTNEKESPRD